MKNILKFDLYKLVKSKSTWIVLAATLAFHVTFLMTYYNFGSARGNFAVLNHNLEVNAVSYLLPLFVLLFVGKDFSKGYIKNIYSSVNKIYYILSKAVIIVISVFTMYIGMFLLDIVFNYIWGAGAIYIDDGHSLSWCLAYRGVALLTHIVSGLWIMLFYLLVRSRLAVFGIDMVYTNGVRYPFISLLVKFFCLFGAENNKVESFFQRYFLYGMRENLFLGGGGTILGHYLWVLAIYAIVFLATSYLVFSKRKF